MKARWLLVLGLSLAWLGPPLGAAETKKENLKTYHVPYRLTDVHHVLVRVKINGKGPFNFIIDTGAPALFVATKVCKKLGIQKDKDGWGTFDRFEIEGGVVIPKAKGRVETPFQLEGMNALGLAGGELHGIIGYNILARYRMVFDFTKDKLAWTELNYNPALPKSLRGGKGGAPGGLDALGGIIKMLSVLLPKRPPTHYQYRGYLGVELASAEGDSEGVLVKAVYPKSPADAAGLKAGDRITQLNKVEVADLDDFEKYATKLRAGQKARLTVSRKGQTREVAITVGEGL